VFDQSRLLGSHGRDRPSFRDRYSFAALRYATTMPGGPCRAAHRISYVVRGSLTETPGSLQEGRRTSARRARSATNSIDLLGIHVVLCDKWKSNGLTARTYRAVNQQRRGSAHVWRAIRSQVTPAILSQVPPAAIGQVKAQRIPGNSQCSPAPALRRGPFVQSTLFGKSTAQGRAC